jgi:hypothetical protein
MAGWTSELSQFDFYRTSAYIAVKPASLRFAQ